jgi:hypothetical protein
MLEEDGVTTTEGVDLATVTLEEMPVALGKISELEVSGV